MQNYWNLDLQSKRRQLTGPLIIGTSEKRAPGPERIQILRHLDGTFDWLSVSSFVY